MSYDAKNDAKGPSAEIFDRDFIHVPGELRGDIKLFALSTCKWCAKTRMWLEGHDIDYDYIYVDLTDGEEREKILKELDHYNPDRSFPTLVINEGTVIVGYDPEELADEFHFGSS